MALNDKKILTTVVYYTLIALTLANAAFFAYVLMLRDVQMWAKVVYYIWIGLVIGVTVFDIICTTSGESKQISAWVVYILSVLAVAMSCLLYFINSTETGLSADFFNLFVSVSVLAIMTSGYMIAAWCAGSRLIREQQIDENSSK